LENFTRTKIVDGLLIKKKMSMKIFTKLKSAIFFNI